MNPSAFILRIAPSGGDRVPEALQSDQIIIGWAEAAGLLDLSLSWPQFRHIIHQTYYKDEPTQHKAGNAGGHMWRFIRDMREGDLVVVPYGNNFYVAEVASPAVYDPSKVSSDSAYRRSVRWLNEKRPIPRQIARAALVSRMKTYGTTAVASDLLGEIMECLQIAKTGDTHNFTRDLHVRLTREVLAEIRNGRMDSYQFEHLLRTVLITLGARSVRVIPRNQDKGADLIAEFRVAGAFQQIVAVQAKHWQSEPPVGCAVVEQLSRESRRNPLRWDL